MCLDECLGEMTLPNMAKTLSSSRPPVAVSVMAHPLYTHFRTLGPLDSNNGATVLSIGTGMVIDDGVLSSVHKRGNNGRHCSYFWLWLKLTIDRNLRLQCKAHPFRQLQAAWAIVCRTPADSSTAVKRLPGLQDPVATSFQPVTFNRACSQVRTTESSSDTGSIAPVPAVDCAMPDEHSLLSECEVVDFVHGYVYAWLTAAAGR